MKRIVAILFLTLAVVTVSSGVASAQVACQRGIAKETSKFVKAKTKALQKCEEAKVKNQHNDTCPNPGAAVGTPARTAADKIAKAISKLHAGVGKACGGADKACGGDLTGETDAAAAGRPNVCPDFENSGCTNIGTIGTCIGIATCLECVSEAAVDQAMDLYYGDLENTDPVSQGALNKCQQTIGKVTSKYLLAKEKALLKCWDKRYKGAHSAVCPDINGDPVTEKDAVKAGQKIAKAESKKIAKLCKACGGSDKLCDDAVVPVDPGVPTFPGSGGADDFSLDDILLGSGPFSCPAVTVPAGPAHGTIACGGTMSTLADLVRCVDCVTEYKVDCIDPNRIDQTFIAYPSECNGGSCPTTLQLDGQEALLDYDLGWGGPAHDRPGPLHGRLTLGISGCSGSGNPDCDICSLSGPLPNAGGAAFATRRCSCDSSISCTADSQCPGSCPCRVFAGPPFPMAIGGVGLCVTTELTAPVTGTIDVEAGALATDVDFVHRLWFGITQFDPCAKCSGGVCVGGTRNGLSCTPQGTSSVHGDTLSLDCPVAATTSAIATLPVSGTLATGTQIMTVSAANPSCTSTGYTALRCLCDTCQTAAQEPCSTNADCPPGRTCGGLRCMLGAPLVGNPCTVPGSNPGECGSGGLCGRPGQPTQPNGCTGNVCTPNTPPDFDSADEGICAGGPFEGRCSIDTFIGCTTASDCACFGCTPGQSCTFAPLPCFTTNGVIADTVLAGGAPDTPVGGIFDPVVSGLFCTGPTGASAVNTVLGMPGLSRPTIPMSATMN